MNTDTKIKHAQKVLLNANVFFGSGGDPEDIELDRTINLNDTFAWALAYGLEVADEDMLEVYDLFINYGWCGIYYWAAEKDGWKKSEFYDITRMIEFVRKEEKIKKEVPDSNKRAYFKAVYTLGAGESKHSGNGTQKHSFIRSIKNFLTKATN